MKTIRPFVPQTVEHYQINDLPWNDLIDYVMPVLKPNSWKVLCFILRKTLGWNKEADKLSYSQIMDAISNQTTSKQTVSTALEELVQGQYILPINESGKTNTTLSYAPNPEFIIETGTKIVPDNDNSSIEIVPDEKEGGTKIVIDDNQTGTKIVPDGPRGVETGTKIVHTKDSSLNPIESNRLPNTSPYGEGGKPPPPVEIVLPETPNEPGRAPPRQNQQLVPAARVFVEVTGKHVLNNTQIKALSEKVGNDPAALEKWRDTVTAWQLRGNKLNNIDGMLDWFRKGIPVYAQTGASKNGFHGKKATKQPGGGEGFDPTDPAQWQAAIKAQKGTS